MKGVSQKTVGIAALFVAFLLGSVNSIARTGFSILDTDSTTYIIIVMLMMFAFIVFYLKEDIQMSTRKRDMVIGGVLFAAYVLVMSYLRVSMSYAFATYRIDAIMFPLILASLIVTLFGIRHLRKFNKLMVYSVFASPLLLLPLIFANGAFANFNSDIVYSILRIVGTNVVKSGVVISGTASSAAVTIASTCVPVGIFIATAMLLLPLAYLYEGKRSKKALWISMAVVAVFVMNIIRMSVITLVWAHSGIGSAVALFHAFAGEFIFYIAIVMFVLLAGRFGLSLKGKTKVKARGAKGQGRIPVYHVAFALLLGAMAFMLTLPYGSMLYASATHFYGAYNASSNPQQLVALELNSLSVTGFNTSNTGSMNGFEIYTATSNAIRPDAMNALNPSIFIISGYLNRPVPGVQMFRNTTVDNVTAELLPNGISLISATSTSNNTNFNLNYFSAPYEINGSYVSINYEAFASATSGASLCGGLPARGQAIILAVNRFESAIDNFLTGHFGSAAPLCYAYQIAAGAS